MLWFPDWWVELSENLGLPPFFTFFIVGFLIYAYLTNRKYGEGAPIVNTKAQPTKEEKMSLAKDAIGKRRRRGPMRT